MPAASLADPVLNNLFDGLMGFTRVAVAVSGGSDSMALLHLVRQWQSKGGPSEIVALTVDHGLRAESAAEAEQVASWCAALGVPHQVLVWEGVKPTTGIQAAARHARYDLMSAWARANRFQVVMTGHTADDQAETVMMRQSRTSSERSLAAIWPENEWKGVKLLRPLLQVRREALRTHLRQMGQDWIDDPSNHNLTFERVRVREGMRAEDVASLVATASAAQQRVAALDGKVSAWLRAHMSVDAFAVVRLQRSAFMQSDVDVRAAALRWAVDAAGAGHAVEAAVIHAVADWIGGGHASRRSCGGAIVSARKHVIEVMREPARLRERFKPLDGTGQLVFDGRFVVTAPIGSQVGAMGVKPLLKRPKAVPAFAFSALPVVKLPHGEVVCAVDGGRYGVSATLCERFTV